MWKKKKSFNFFKNMLLYIYGEVSHVIQTTNINKNNKERTGPKKKGKSQKNWSK